jgi:hypothetical protein
MIIAIISTLASILVIDYARRFAVIITIASILVIDCARRFAGYRQSSKYSIYRFKLEGLQLSSL